MVDRQLGFRRLRDQIESAAFLVSRGGSERQAHSELVRALIALSEIERAYSTGGAVETVSERDAAEVRKVQSRLRLWARPDRQHQINVRIVNAFLRLEKSGAVVGEDDLRRELVDVDSFDSNFAQMKTIADKNHGKIFEQEGSAVKLWAPIECYVREYERAVGGGWDGGAHTESHTIISVDIVPGSELKPHWKSPMQVVITDRGKYIDTVQGYDWKSRVGQAVDGIRVSESGGFKWLNKKN